jgi:uncharacterized membrane protein YphA (DoxX/SURF4 family)
MAWKRPAGDRSGSFTGLPLIVLRVSLGAFMIAKALDKLAWFTDVNILATKLNAFLAKATPGNRWWVTLLIPGVAIFSRLVPVGEFAAGVALVAGRYTRLASILSFLMILNFHLATGALLRSDFPSDGQAFPVLGGLLAVALAGDRSFVSRKKPR